MPINIKRKRRATTAALSREQKLDLQRTDITTAETSRTAPPVVTPIIARPDWCLVELDGELLVVPSAFLSLLMREDAITCGCPRCAAGATV